MRSELGSAFSHVVSVPSLRFQPPHFTCHRDSERFGYIGSMVCAGIQSPRICEEKTSDGEQRT